MKILINRLTNEIINSGNDVIPSSSDEYITEIGADLSLWRGYEIFYNPIRRTFERGNKLYNFQSWNNTTRIEHPENDLLGYNTERTRLEFYIKSLDHWFYLWSEFIVITETPTLPYFWENFETGWLIEGTFTNIFSELFETNWFVDNPFTGLFAENFQGIDW